ncbi:type IV secretory system conjugative DNA transfer family protein [Streptomyces sp. NBC_01768]|uniref:type IV secretory system conjugative DNA transfer family protein n=1 Tax=Streptomyces sp. NBC_01768 TaxID=2975938 RepID=UPI002DDA9DFD|nr:type IV secretory system conjugative DNA transfer family protein [Streptomyces sp. NBC_01768]WSC28798.1 type IV secretory system conjugative DNA transfer family protein [Streptomyces sp. NBC_01768]
MAGRAEQRTGGNSSGGNGGGIPDGMLIGLLAFLLGLTLLAWTATGLAGLFAHGAWPEGVTLAETPLSMRRLVTAPHDLPAAWPNTPAGELSGYGLFWGLFIGELMVLLVLTVFVLGVVARWRAVRARQRAERYGGGEADEYAYEDEPVRARQRHEPRRRARRNDAAVPMKHTPADTAPLPRTEAAPAVGSTPGPRAEPTTATTTATGAEAATGPHAERETSPEPSQAPGPAPDPGAPVVPPLPSPRAPVVYGPATTRRPTAVQAIREADGPALVVTSDPTVWAETKDARAKLGPVLVYDPGHLCDTPARLHWSPTAGCEKPDTAAARSAALLAPVRPQARIDAATADTAETLLQCWLHAAAIDGRPFRQVHRWALGGSAHEPVRLLRTHPKAASGLAGLLESALTAHPERREMAKELTVRAFGALSSVHIREACTPNRADSLALESFADEGGTLYVVGEPIEDPRSGPGAMPLLTALAAHVVEHGRRMAARSTDGRLDPPMTLVLDDIAAVAPLPRLPELLANGRATGLPTLALLRSREQARARWPQGV